MWGDPIVYNDGMAVPMETESFELQKSAGCFRNPYFLPLSLIAQQLAALIITTYRYYVICVGMCCF